MNVLEMTKRTNGDMTVFPRGKKKIAIAGIAILLVVAGMLAAVGNRSDRLPVGQPVGGSDVKDLAIARPATGVSIRGTVTINKQIPLPRGFVVAYGLSMQQAIASSPIQRDGSYKLENVPPYPLVLMVKRSLIDDPNPEFEKTMGEMPGLPDLRNAGGKRPGSGVSLGKSGPRFLTGKQPSKEVLSRLKADIVTPDMEALPEVRWLTDFAFFKYGGLDPDMQKIIAPEGKKVVMMNLTVP